MTDGWWLQIDAIQRRRLVDDGEGVVAVELVEERKRNKKPNKPLNLMRVILKPHEACRPCKDKRFSSKRILLICRLALLAVSLAALMATLHHLATSRTMTDLLNQQLFDAVENGHLDTVQRLVESHDLAIDARDARNDNGSALHIAAMFNQHHVARLLIRHKADINAINHDRHTPLHLAASYGHVETARVLLEHLAATDCMSIEFGSTPLHRAACHGHIELAKLLLDHGVNVAARNHHGASPVFDAVKFGGIDMVRLLLERQADINEADSYKNTLLHAAATQDSLNMACFLVENQANINATNASGLTPLHVAKGQVALMLIDYGADINIGCKVCVCVCVHDALVPRLALTLACQHAENQPNTNPLHPRSKAQASYDRARYASCSWH
jgi:ankyrin repeat protein